MKRRKEKRERRKQLVRNVFCTFMGVFFIIVGAAMRNDNMRYQEGDSKEEILFNALSEGEKMKVKKRSTVTCILQNPELPTGCEATAGTMLLKAYGYEADKMDVAGAMKCLPLTERDGRLYGGHPDEVFVGNPEEVSSYGAFPNVLAEAMQQVIDREGARHNAVPLYHKSEEELLELVDMGIPVCIWSSSKNLEIEHRRGWYLIRDGVYTDDYFEWPSNEHVLVLVDYDEDEVTVCDPQEGVVRYPRESFFRHYRQVGEYALVLEEK